MRDRVALVIAQCESGGKVQGYDSMSVPGRFGVGAVLVLPG